MGFDGGRSRWVARCSVVAGAALALNACDVMGVGTLFVEPLPRPSLSGPAQIDSGTTAALYSIGLAALTARRSAGESGDFVVSPVGTSAMLAQIALGTRGDALTELERTLGTDPDSISDQYGQVWALWTPWAGDPGRVAGEKVPDEPVVGLNSRITVDDQMNVEQPWVDEIGQTWGTPVDSFDLQASGAEGSLDEWASSASGGLIPRSGIKLDGDTRLVGQNAVVFGAPWLTPFDPEDTTSRPFTRSDGTLVSVDMMSQTSDLAASVDGEWTTATLPYADGDLIAYLLMPDDPAAPLDVGSVAEALALAGSASAEMTSVEVPKVRAQGTQDLIGTLTDLGLEDLVDGSADLSGIGTADDGPIVLAQAVSQTVLRMDEDGTLAAAVNEFGIEAISGEAVVLGRTITFNHPYLVVLAERETQVPLFMAWIGDPSRDAE